MPELSLRVLAFYAAFTYPFALLCAIPFFDRPVVLDAAHERKMLRTARLLALIAPIHVLFGLAALGLVREAERAGSEPEQNASLRRTTSLFARVTVVLSMLVLSVLALTQA